MLFYTPFLASLPFGLTFPLVPSAADKRTHLMQKPGSSAVVVVVVVGVVVVIVVGLVVLI